MLKLYRPDHPHPNILTSVKPSELASDSETSVLQAINHQDVDTIQAVIVHYLDLVPRDRTGLTFQQTQTYREEIPLLKKCTALI